MFLESARKVLSLAVFGLMCIGPPVAHADCTDPPGIEGQIVYNTNYNLPQVCTGADWYGLGVLNPSAGGSGCTNPAGVEGQIVYNATYHLPQYCDGDDWRGMIAASAVSTSVPADCTGLGAAHYNDTATGHCYFSSEVQHHWNDGKAFCEANGGHLATIESATENAVVWSFADSLTGGSDFFFLGGSDSAVEGEWRWVGGPSDGVQFWQGDMNGSPVGGNYANWAASDPDDDGGEGDVLMLTIYHAPGEWGDMPAHWGKTEICEKEPTIGGTPTASGCTAPTLCPNVGDVCDDGNVATANDPIFAGFIAYNDPNSSDAGKCEPLYVTNNNQSASAQWKTSTGANDVATDSFEDGQVIDAQVPNSAAFPAFKLCKDLTDGGYTDWYLPARDELVLLWKHKDAIDASAAGAFAAGEYYWASTESSVTQAWGQNSNGSGGVADPSSKTDNEHVRCVRRN